MAKYAEAFPLLKTPDMCRCHRTEPWCVLYGLEGSIKFHVPNMEDKKAIRELTKRDINLTMES